MAANQLLQLLIASPLHLLLLLIVLAILAFRAPRGRALRGWRYPLIVLAGWVWVSATPAIAHALLVRLESVHPPLRVELSEGQQPTIAVLSGGDPFDAASPDELQLNLASLRRTLAGAGLWKEIGGELLFVGSIRNEAVPVGKRMARLARETGVEARAIRLLPGSLNTYRNLVDLSEEEAREQPLFLVTSAWHMPRALAVARALDMKVIPVAVDYRGKRNLTWRAWIPSNGGLALMRLALHEYVGLAYYRWRGWVG